MRLTEILVCMAISVTASLAFMGSLINVRRSVTESEKASCGVSAVLDTDILLRREMRKADIPYWKNFRREYEKEKERLFLFASENGIDVLEISPVYDEKSGAEGIEIEWARGAVSAVTREYIRQRIVDE